MTDVTRLLKTASEFLTDAYLVSAYDISYGKVPQPADLPCKTDIVFLDSGGYEASIDHEYSAVGPPECPPREWTREQLHSVLCDWPAEIPAAFVSFDHPMHRQPLEEQIRHAKRLFQQHRDHLRILLLKPTSRRQGTLRKTIADAVADVESLRGFDIIGVTEKELGRTMLDRMTAVTKLRVAMDHADVQVPLHIFGALDPLSVCLYYVSGAEIFDGLSWLRYGYKDGLCVYTHNIGATAYGLHVSDDDVRTRALTNNYYTLQELQHQLLKLEATGKVEKLEHHVVTIAAAVDSMKTRFKDKF